MQYRLETKWNLLSIKSIASSCSCFAIYKDMQHRSKHHPIVERGAAGQNWIPCLFDIHWFHTIFHSKNGCITAYFYQAEFSQPVDGLSGPCSLFLPDVQIWICTVYTQDLKPKSSHTIHTYIHTYIYISLSPCSSTPGTPQNWDKHKQMFEDTHVLHYSIHKTYPPQKKKHTHTHSPPLSLFFGEPYRFPLHNQYLLSWARGASTVLALMVF